MAWKDKIIPCSNGVTGVLSFLGGYQVCHNVCMGIITLLAVLGITVVGMPLAFLTSVAVPFWITAVILLFISLLMYWKMKCISKSMLIFNSGLIMAGVPFGWAQKVQLELWIIGGALIILSVVLFICGTEK